MIDASTLRLALFSDTCLPQINGVSRTLARLLDAVHARGGAARMFTVHDPAASTSDDSNGSVATDRASPVRYPSRSFWAYDSLRLAWPSRRAVQRDVSAFAPTLIHAATEFGVGLAGRAMARRGGIPFVSSYHTNFAAYAAYYRLGMLRAPAWSYLKWFHNGGLRTYCPTQSIVTDVNAHGFRRTALWSRGIDTEQFAPHFRSDELRRTIGASDDTLVVSYVGRLAAEKGLRVALDALRLVDVARPGKMRFAAIGDGPLQRDVADQAPPGSWIPGALHGRGLSAAYASSDVFLFPSVTDTFGNVLLEAMASGIPVLAFEAGPTRELVADDRGWLVQPVNAAALAAQLVRIIDARAAVVHAGKQALSHARTRTWDRVWDALITDYISLHRLPARVG